LGLLQPGHRQRRDSDDHGGNDAGDHGGNGDHPDQPDVPLQRGSVARGGRERGGRSAGEHRDRPLRPPGDERAFTGVLEHDDAGLEQHDAGVLNSPPPQRGR
jgi:hypothetical protein